MYRENVFNEIRKEIITKLESIDLHEFKEFHQWVIPHFELLSNLSTIKDFESSKKTENDEELEVTETNSSYPIGHIFTIDKKALGAVIKELNYPIPEDMVREMEIENGYKIQIIGQVGCFYDKSPKWDFKVVEKTLEPNPNLIKIEKGVVSRVGHRFVVERTINGPIQLENPSDLLTISQKDIVRLRENNMYLNDGDIIDGRFYINNPSGSFRVTYKHEYQFNEVEQQSIEARKLLHRKNNTSDTEAGPSMLDQLDKKPFLNRTIVLVGLESRMNDFAMMLKGVNGIDLVHLSGDEAKTTMRSKLKKADYVLLSTYETSHDASKFSVKLCKEFEIPCTYTHADGLKGVLVDAAELISLTEN